MLAVRCSHYSPANFIIMIFPVIMFPCLWAPVSQSHELGDGPQQIKWLNLPGMSDCTIGINPQSVSSFCILFWHLLHEDNSNCNLYYTLLADFLWFRTWQWDLSLVFIFGNCFSLSFYTCLFSPAVALCFPSPCLDHQQLKAQRIHLISWMFPSRWKEVLSVQMLQCS